ncbi:hypothetical protein QOT17_019567 [Balamuthia mandrillaris]
MNIHKEGEDWVARYGRPSIVRPQDEYEEPPPPEIPRNMLPKLAKEVAEWDRAMAWEERRPFGVRLAGWVAFNILGMILVAATYFIPPSTMQRKGLDWFWSYLHNDWFPWDSFALWMALLVLGYTYVSFFTCGRNNPFHNRSKNYREFFIVILLGLIWFLLAPVFTLCSNKTAETGGSHLTSSIFSKIGLKENSIGLCAVYNYFFYVLPFFVGIIFTYVDRNAHLRGIRIHLVGCRCKKFNATQYIVILLLSTFWVLLLGFHIWLLTREGLYYVLAYVLAYILLISALCVSSVYTYLCAGWSFHAHHWFVALMLIPLTRFVNPLSAMTQGLLAGIFVEGIARWNFASTWKSAQRIHYRLLYLQWLKGRSTTYYPDHEDSFDKQEALVLSRIF